ncbi:MAG: hypothetical protein P1U77_28660, partial [Rubripirellula sp.]|nr:hypothetical protein [Rubripirellula sp.]
MSMREMQTASTNDNNEKSRSCLAKAGPPIEVKIHRNFSEVEGIRDEWNKLWEASPRRDFFDHYDWVRSIATTTGFSSTRQLCICVGIYNGEVVAILPLALDSKTLRFIGAPRSDYNDLLCRNGFEESSLKAFLAFLLRVEPSWTQCVFGNVPEDSTLLSALSNNELEKEVNIVRERASTCLTLNLACMSQPDIERLLRKRTFRYYENRLLRRGNLTFRHLDSKNAAMDHFERFV